jgi:hypothetical protein
MEQGDSISDVLDALPSAEVIEGIVDYYFNNCQWVYLRVGESEFRKHWAQVKAGFSKDCLVLATCCGILALTMYVGSFRFMINHHFDESSVGCTFQTNIHSR